MFSNDVCIVGTGRVGLPLALSLSQVGYSVVGIDRSEQLRNDVNSGIMPFHEPGYKKIILEKILLEENIIEKVLLKNKNLQKNLEITLPISVQVARFSTHSRACKNGFRWPLIGSD